MAGTCSRWRRVAGVVGVLAGAVVLAELAAGLAQSAGDESKLPGDLRAVPTDAVGFVSVRLADVWQHDVGRKVREEFKEQLPGALEEWRRAVGLPPDEIERLTLVDLAVPPGPDPQVFVATARPYDRAKVLAAIGPDAREEQLKGQTFYVGPRNNAIHFVDDRAYVVSSAAGVRELLERPAPKKVGALAAALPLAAGKHTLVAAVNGAVVAAQVPEDQLPGVVEPFKPLLKTQLATLTADLGEAVRGDLRLTFADEKEAKEAEKAVKAGLSLARVGLGLAAQQVRKDPATAKLAGAIGRAQADLEDATVKQDGDRVRVNLEVKADALAVAAVGQAVLKVRQSAERIQSVNNLKQLTLATINYADSMQGRMPAQAVYSPDGKPLLSWRVLILPYVEQGALYKEFHLDEPWDSGHNKKLLAKMPKVFAMPRQPAGATETHYQAFAGPGAFFQGKQRLRYPASFPDGTSNTIMYVEAAKGVPWTKPEDLPFDKEKPLLPLLGGHFPGGFNASLCDGSVRFISASISEATLHAAVTTAGGEVLGSDW